MSKELWGSLNELTKKPHNLLKEDILHQTDGRNLEMGEYWEYTSPQQVYILYVYYLGSCDTKHLAAADPSP